MTTGAARGASKPVPSDTPPSPSQIGGPVFKHMSLWVGGHFHSNHHRMKQELMEKKN